MAAVAMFAGVGGSSASAWHAAVERPPVRCLRWSGREVVRLDLLGRHGDAVEGHGTAEVIRPRRNVLVGRAEQVDARGVVVADVEHHEGPVRRRGALRGSILAVRLSNPEPE